MSKSLRISDELHEALVAHSRDDETLEETLWRLVSGPHPDDVAGILSDETAEEMRNRLGAKRRTNVEGKRDLREQFE